MLALGGAALASLGFACASIVGIDDRLPDDVAAEASVDRFVASMDASVAPSTCPPMAKCVAVPDGWVLTSLAPAARPGCADGYGLPEDVIVAADGLGCICTCTEKTPGSCAAANATMTLRDYPAAGCSASTSTHPLTVLDGGCANVTIPTTPDVRVNTPMPVVPSCTADAGPTALRGGQACAAQGASCNDGGMCASALPAGQRLCIEQAGDVTCPAGFDRKFNVGASAGADTRQCGTCKCTPDATCDEPAVDLFTGLDCTSDNLHVPATGSCTAVDGGASYASYRFSGQAPGCHPSTPPLLDGGVTLATLRTLCCEQRN